MKRVSWCFDHSKWALSCTYFGLDILVLVDIVTIDCHQSKESSNDSNKLDRKHVLRVWLERKQLEHLSSIHLVCFHLLIENLSSIHSKHPFSESWTFVSWSKQRGDESTQLSTHSSSCWHGKHTIDCLPQVPAVSKHVQASQYITIQGAKQSSSINQYSHHHFIINQAVQSSSLASLANNH